MAPSENDHPIPERFTAYENTWVQVANLVQPIDPMFVQRLREAGYDVAVEHAFEWTGMPPQARTFMPLLRGTVYEYRPSVPITSPPLDTSLRGALVRNGARLESTRATVVSKIFQGGQKGEKRGGIYVYENYGPLIISTSTGDAMSDLQTTITAYKRIAKKVDPNPQSGMTFQESILKQAVTEAKGMATVVRRSSIPVGILSLPGTDGSWVPIVRCFPDSQTVISMDGQPLPYPTFDGKTRAAVAWPNLESISL